jgi:hypothetical protein
MWLLRITIELSLLKVILERAMSDEGDYVVLVQD